MSLSGVLNAHGMAANVLKASGTDEQRKRWLPRLASGEIRGALSLSEPDAGSDTSAITGRAVRDGDEDRITGTKMWGTNGLRAGRVGPAARTDESLTSSY